MLVVDLSELVDGERRLAVIVRVLVELLYSFSKRESSRVVECLPVR